VNKRLDGGGKREGKESDFRLDGGRSTINDGMWRVKGK